VSDTLRERREQLRELARAEGADGALVFSWRRATVAWFASYFPGYLSNWTVLWVGVDGSEQLGVRFPFDVDRARAASHLSVSAVAAPELLVPAGATRIVLVAGDLAVNETPVALSRWADRSGVELLDRQPVVDRWRAVKSPAEVDHLAVATQVAWQAVAAARESFAVGANDFELAAQVEATARRLGASRCLCLVGIGRGSVITEATGKVVGPEDPVGFEITLTWQGACVHVLDTILPDPSDGSLEHCHAVRQVLLDMLRPGIPVDEVVAAGDKELAARGLLPYKEYDFGHGVGADTPELPQLISGTGVIAEAGMTLAVHVAVRQPDGATAAWGTTAVVGERGARDL